MTRAAAGTASPRRVAAVLAGAGLIGISSQAALIPLLGELPDLVGVGTEAATWTMTISLLAAAIATPVSGRLADLVGRKRVLVWCLGATALGSALCAVGQVYPLLLAGRALQGLSSAVIPLGISALAEVATGARLYRGAALISATMGIGTAAGVTYSGVVTAVSNWHVVFWLAAALGAAMTVAVAVLVPGSSTVAEERQRFDGTGAVLLSAGLTAVLLAVTNGGRWGWDSPATTGCAVGGLAVLALWWWWEQRTVDPLVDLRAATEPRMALVQAASVMAGVAMFTHVMVLPVLLQQPVDPDRSGSSVLVAGLCLVPAGLMMMVAAPLSTLVVRRAGARLALGSGLALSAAGYGASAAVTSWPAAVVAASLLIGLGIGLTFATLPSIVVALTDPAAVGAANGLNTLMRMVGASFSSAVVGALLAAHGGSGGYDWAYVWGALAALVGVLLAARLPRSL